MERAYNTWQRESKVNKDEDDNYYDYWVAFAKVRTHVWDAINEGQIQIHNIEDTQQLKAERPTAHGRI